MERKCCSLCCAFLHSFSLLCRVVCCVWCLGHKNATLPSKIRTNVSQFHPSLFSLLVDPIGDHLDFIFHFVLQFRSVAATVLYSTYKKTLDCLILYFFRSIRIFSHLAKKSNQFSSSSLTSPPVQVAVQEFAASLQEKLTMTREI
jgi:hypothetical protein